MEVLLEVAKFIVLENDVLLDIVVRTEVGGRALRSVILQ